MRLYLLLLAPILALASEVSFADSDFIARSINFVIFVAFLWWLLAKRFRAMAKERQDKIAAQLNAVQDKLALSAKKKDDALKALEDSKILAKDIVANAQKEAQILATNIENQCKTDIANIQKSHAERLNFEQKRIKKAVIDEVLDELLADDKIALNKKAFVEILTKKVA